MNRGLSTSLSTISSESLISLTLEEWGKLTDAFILLVNVDGCVLKSSQNSLAYLGIESENLRGSHLQDWEFSVGTDSEPTQSRALLRKIESDQFADSCFLSLSDCEGSECKLIFHGCLLNSKGDEAQQLLLVGRDVEYRVSSSGDDVNELKAEKVKVLREVAGQTAHRFNNILTALGCQISVLEEMTSNNDQLRNVQQELTKIFGQFKMQSHELSRACAEIKS